MPRLTTCLVDQIATVASVAVGLLALMSLIAVATSVTGVAIPASKRTALAHFDSKVHLHGMTTATPTEPASNKVTGSAHIGYLNCPAPDVLLTASIQKGVFAPGQLVTYRVAVHNLSRTICGTPRRNLPAVPTTPNSAGLLGPCGELSVVVYNAEGTNVYPGRVAYGCPLILGPSIPPGQTIATTGMWQPGGSRGPGPYRLVIDGKVTLPIVITATAPTTRPAPSPAVPAPSPSLGSPGLGSPPILRTRVPPRSALSTPPVPFGLSGLGS